MKKLVTTALALCILTSLATIAKADDDAKKKERENKRAEMIKKYDKDGDGKLNDEEKAAMKEDQKKKKGEKKKEAK